MKQSTVLHKSLTAGVVTSLLLATGVFDTLGAFIRTNLDGTPNNQCGFGYGYDDIAGYGNGYGPACPSGSSAGGGRTGGNSGTRPSSTGSISTPWDKDNNKPKPPTNDTKNPYGSNRDDGFVGSGSRSWDKDIQVPTTETDTNNNSTNSTGPTKRKLPATGA